MAVKDFTLRVSGTVAYSDRSHGSFEAVGRWKGQFGGLVAQHTNADSLENFRRLYASNSTGVEQVLDALAPNPTDGGVVALTPAAPSVAKTVSSFVLEVSGLVAYTDNSKASFIVQWVDGVVNVFPTETVQTWQDLTEAVGATSPRAFLVTVFEAVAGVGDVSIT